MLSLKVKIQFGNQEFTDVGGHKTSVELMLSSSLITDLVCRGKWPLDCGVEMSFVHPTVSGQGLEHLAQMTLYSLKPLKEKTLVLLRDHIRSSNIKAGRVETFLFSCPHFTKGNTEA